MKPAKRLESIALFFEGPYSPELFNLMSQVKRFSNFETVTIGTGESKAVAAVRAIAHLKGKGYGPVMDEINFEVQRLMPAAPHTVEGDSMCQVYCILGVTAER